MRALACAASDALARAAGSLWSIYGNTALCLFLWFAYPPKPGDGPVTLLTYVGYIMLFVIQRSGERDTKAIKSGTQEIARALPNADEAVMVRD